jgi:hypothetical protein
LLGFDVVDDGGDAVAHVAYVDGFRRMSSATRLNHVFGRFFAGRSGNGGECMNSPMLTDTTIVTTAIKDLLCTGVSEKELLTRVMQTFPHLTVAELSAALQDAAAAVETQARRRWWHIRR